MAEDWQEMQENGLTVYKCKTSGVLQREHPCDAEIFEAIRRFKERCWTDWTIMIMSKARNVTAILQEEEASDSWSLFAFAYNQWLCKARMMVSKRLEQQHDRAKKEGGNFPEHMTDQVSTENNAFLHYN